MKQMKLTSKKVKDYMSHRTDEEFTHCPNAIAEACNDMAEEHGCTDFASAADPLDYLRLLFGRAGEPHCHHCGIPIAPQRIDEMVDQILLLPEGTRYQLLAPVVRGKKGTHTKLISGLAAEGFARVRINGEVRELADSIELDKNQIHNIEVVLDRLIAREGIQ